jgi:hypothetical protein
MIASRFGFTNTKLVIRGHGDTHKFHTRYLIVHAGAAADR